MSRRLPKFGSMIEVIVGDPAGSTYRAHLEDAEDDRLSAIVPVNAELRAASDSGGPATVRWSAGTLGTASAPARLSHDGGSQLTIELVGPVTLEQNRRFVRGGGFEHIDLRREVADDGTIYTGWVTDLSEASVGARFASLVVEPGDSVSLSVDLDGTHLRTLGLVRKVTESELANQGTTVVIGYRLEENWASAVRRYLLRRETIDRARRQQWSPEH
jgi:hypothetical protein